MSSTVRIMYKTGEVFNIIIFGISIFFIVTGIFNIAFSKEIAQSALEKHISIFDNPNEVKLLGRNILIIATSIFVLTIVTLILATISKNMIETSNVGNTKPYVILLVIGVFNNPLYFMAGVFGLVETRNISSNFGSM